MDVFIPYLEREGNLKYERALAAIDVGHGSLHVALGLEQRYEEMLGTSGPGGLYLLTGGDILLQREQHKF